MHKKTKSYSAQLTTFYFFSSLIIETTVRLFFSLYFLSPILFHLVHKTVGPYLHRSSKRFFYLRFFFNGPPCLDVGSRVASSSMPRCTLALPSPNQCPSPLFLPVAPPPIPKLVPCQSGPRTRAGAMGTRRSRAKLFFLALGAHSSSSQQIGWALLSRKPKTTPNPTKLDPKYRFLWLAVSVTVLVPGMFSDRLQLWFR